MAAILTAMMAAILNLCNQTNGTYVGSYNRYIYQILAKSAKRFTSFGFFSFNGGHIGSHDGGHFEFL